MDSAWKTTMIDQAAYLWRIRHGWLVLPECGLKGLSVEMRLDAEHSRSLIIDFPVDEPLKPQLSEARPAE